MKDSGALAQAIIRILTDGELARQMGRAGRKRAEEEFDERLVLERQINIYRQLIAQRLQLELSDGRA